MFKIVLIGSRDQAVLEHLDFDETRSQTDKFMIMIRDAEKIEFMLQNIVMRIVIDR